MRFGCNCRRSGFTVPGASALTAAGLRPLPVLSTHLSLPQIAGELFLSRNTIKPEANSVYRTPGRWPHGPAMGRRGLSAGTLCGPAVRGCGPGTRQSRDVRL
jgi:hypothetical protein